MAYQDLALRNIAGEVAVTYNDNNMRSNSVPESTSGPRVFATGTARAGVVGEPYTIISQALMHGEFDSRSEIANVVGGARLSNSELPLTIARVGAKPYHVILERPIAGSYEKEPLLVITPMTVREADSARNIRSTLESYKLILLPHIQGNLIRQRVLIIGFNNNESQHNVIYDSERLFQVNGDAIFDVEINVPLGECLVTQGAYDANNVLAANFTSDDIQTVSDLNGFIYKDLPKLSDTQAVIFSKIDMLGTASATVTTLTDPAYSLTTIPGASGEHISHVERYASNELVYQKLEFEDFQYLYCEKCYADVNPVSLTSEMTLPEQLGWHDKSLGHLWKYDFNGLPYIYTFARNTPISAANVATYTYDSITYTLSADHQAAGDLLNLVELHFHANASGTTTSVESFVNRKGLIECHVEFAHDTNRMNNEHSIETPFCKLEFLNTKFSDGDDLIIRLRPSTIDGTRTLSDHILANSYNLDPFVLTPFDTTQDKVPEGVVDRLITFAEDIDGTAASIPVVVASNVEVREVSFLHQTAQAAYTASTNYNQVIALIPTSPPPANQSGISTWAGNAGTYQINGAGEIVITKNGTGVLGTRLLAGATDYRNGAAFGGVMLTNGDSLPNGIPYGVDDTDEAVDANNNPIDIGKHCVVIGAYGAVATAASMYPMNGTRPQTRTVASNFQNAGPLIAAMLNRLAPGTEPIGPTLGRVPGFSPQQRTPRKVLNDLAALRICMVDQTGVISSIYTSALRTSDYSKISTVISANAVVANIRALCSPYIGQAYSDAQMASLQQLVDGASRSLVNQNYAQAVDVVFSGSRLDRLNGVLRCAVTFVPPLSIEAITIDLTLQAPAA